MKKQFITIPHELRHALFFTGEEVRLPAEVSIGAYPFFIYEMLGQEQPWLSEEKGLSMIEAEWHELKMTLQQKFEKRDQTIQEEMKAAIALFFMELFWSNSLPVQLNGWQQKISFLEIKPVNMKERIEFILRRPYSYQAYIQLCELMTEQVKKIARYRVVKK
ncbi:hypothetical protein QYG89_00540 [Bacillus sp. B190/17]|uniref:YpoC-like domain-containing protein n=1 Tax=Bacillus lumedeiriae TaxID=3058829 RepID=A0ABW8I612_9BACI